MIIDQQFKLFTTWAIAIQITIDKENILFEKEKKLSEQNLNCSNYVNFCWHIFEDDCEWLNWPKKKIEWSYNDKTVFNSMSMILLDKHCHKHYLRIKNE